MFNMRRSDPTTICLLMNTKTCPENSAMVVSKGTDCCLLKNTKTLPDVSAMVLRKSPTFCLLMNTKTLPDISAMVLRKGLFDSVLPAGACSDTPERLRASQALIAGPSTPSHPIV